MNFNEHKTLIVYFVLLKIFSAESQTISTIATGLATNAKFDKKSLTINDNSDSVKNISSNATASNGSASSPSTLPLKLNLSNSLDLTTLNSLLKLITSSPANIMTQQNSAVSNNPLTQSNLMTIPSSNAMTTLKVPTVALKSDNNLSINSSQVPEFSTVKITLNTISSTLSPITSKNPSIPVNSSNDKLSTGLISAVTDKIPNRPNSAVPQNIGSIAPEISSKTRKILTESSTILKNLNPQTSASETVTTPKISDKTKLNTTQTVITSKPSIISTLLTTVKIGTSIIQEDIMTTSQTTFANSWTTINTDRIFLPRKALGKLYISLCGKN
jgi:hypothetical protein